MPTVAVALTTRFAAGRAMEHFGIGSENLVLKRSAIGFSTAESAATGLVTGALLKPTDDTVANDWGSFVLDRAKGGASGALTYGALNLTALGWKSVAESKFAANLGADTVLKSSFVTGAISGLPGGFVSIQADSLMNDGKLSTDMKKIGQSAYEMGVVGALLGATTNGLSRLSKTQSVQLSANDLLSERQSAPSYSPDVTPISHANESYYSYTNHSMEYSDDYIVPDVRDQSKSDWLILQKNLAPQRSRGMPG